MARVVKVAPMASAASRKRKNRIWLGLRIVLTIAAFAYLFHLVPMADVGRAFLRVAPLAIVAAVALNVVGILVATVRWRLVLVAYGATHSLPLLRLLRLYLIGLFYNTFVPGAVGGDVVRGVATRQAFGKDGTSAALAVVFVERVLGLCGLLLLVSGAFLLSPFEGEARGELETVIWFIVPLGLSASVVALVSLAFGRRLAHWVPWKRAQGILVSLPLIRSVPHFIGALLLSFVTQALVACVGHILISALAPGVGIEQSFVLVPVAAAAAYFPGTVGGAGTREGVFVYLYGLIAVASENALAASLLMLCAQATVAATGGILQLISPAPAAKPAEVDGSSD